MVDIRKATLADIPFLTEVIIETEKSGTNILSYSTIFGMDINEVKEAIAQMLDEEIDHCEYAVSAFMIAEEDGKALGAICAWVEAAEDIPSSTLKGNLLRFTINKENFERAIALNPIIREVHLEYIPGTVQVGLVYITPGARGKGLVKMLLDAQLERLKAEHPEAEEVYLQVFGNNEAAIKSYKKLGFNVVETKKATTPKITQYLPCDTKMLMKLN